jgi:catechol 2,3-dioxygenase-like lactoylglutathione lyase family enzyme
MALPLGVAIPTLPSRDLGATAAFYGGLGFAVESRFGDEYLVLVRDGLELHFFGCPGVDPATTIAGCYLRVRDADAFHEAFAAAGVPRGTRGAPRLQGPPQDTDYGLREFALVDPDGNLLRIGSPSDGPSPVSPAA